VSQQRKTAKTRRTAGPVGPTGLRPLTARSVAASTLLGMHPPRLSSRMLVASGELFGIAEGATRTALHRMVAMGELRQHDGAYELAGRLLARQARQDASRRPPEREWDGRWEVQVVRAERRPARERAELRAAMAALALVELREGVWLRPDNLDPARQPDARAVVAAQCRSLHGEVGDDPVALAAELWDLAAWAQRADVLRNQLADVRPALEDGRLDVLPRGFELSAAALRHLLADPMLPGDLTPPQWPGPALRIEYDSYDAAFTSLWRAWYHAQDVEDRARGAAREP
jgi:phenylacetic acid degradation operon negative regulatory protein